MGNRAVIATEDKDVGVYLHWNGGKESVETFLAYCDLKGYRPPETDCYGWARLCQVCGNFFGGSTSLGVDKYERLDTDNWDNGVYIIKDWKIIGREYQKYDDYELTPEELEERLIALNEDQPAKEQLTKEEMHVYVEKWAIDKGYIKKEPLPEFYEKAQELLESYEEHKDKKIQFILESPDDKYGAKVVASDIDEIVVINPVTKEINFIQEWDFNIDNNILQELKDKDITYMNMSTHFAIWQYVGDNYPDIDNKEGLQKYLKYCKDHEITKEKVEIEGKVKGLTDIMKYYKPQEKEVR